MKLDSHWSSPVSHAGSVGREPCLSLTAVSSDFRFGGYGDTIRLIELKPEPAASEASAR